MGPEKVVRFPGPCGYLKLNLGALEEGHMLSFTKTSLQTLYKLFVLMQGSRKDTFQIHQ